jgi:hypothetical protein
MNVVGDMRLQFNGDTGSNYSYVRAFGGEGTADSTSGTETSLRTQTGNASSGNSFGGVFFYSNIFDYSATDKHKAVLSRSTSSFTSMLAGRWANTSAITSIKIITTSGDINSGSTFALYGIVS